MKNLIVIILLTVFFKCETNHIYKIQFVDSFDKIILDLEKDFSTSKFIHFTKKESEKINDLFLLKGSIRVILDDELIIEYNIQNFYSSELKGNNVLYCNDNGKLEIQELCIQIPNGSISGEE